MAPEDATPEVEPQDTPIETASTETPVEQSDTTREQDIAWAAGLFEGEGCIHLNRTRTGRYIQLALATTDRDVLDRFLRVMEVGQIYYKKPRLARHKPQWQWRCATREGVAHARSLLLPHLGSRRTEKWADCIEHASAPVRPGRKIIELREQHA